MMNLKRRKQDLRKTVDAEVARLTKDAVAEASQRICARLCGLDAVRAASCLALYAAFGREVDLSAVARWAVGEGKRVFYPRFNADTAIYEMVPVDDPGRTLVPGHWGLLEPPAETPAIEESLRCSELTWLVPGVAFDREGHRLGRGGGYYDRMLANTEGPRIGVAHRCQLVPSVPVGADDVQMNDVITDAETVVVRDDEPSARERT